MEHALPPAFCPHCGAPLEREGDPCPACDGTPPSREISALLLELRALRTLHEQAGQRLERLETLLAAPRPEKVPKVSQHSDEFSFEAAEEFTFAEAEPEPTPPPSPPSPRGRPFVHGPADRPAPVTPGPEPKSRESLESALGRKWLLAVGVVVLVFGVGFFLKYTFAQGWIGPSGQLTLAYIFGALLTGGGEWARRRGYAPFGLWILGGGLASFYFATFAGYQLFELLPQAPAFGLFAATTVAAVALAVLHNAPGLAALGLCGGYLTPFVLGGFSANTYFLLGYVTVLNAGVLEASLFRRWKVLPWLGLVASFAVFSFLQLKLSLFWLFSNLPREHFWESVIFISLNFLGYSCAPLLGCVSRKSRPATPAALTVMAWLAAAASYMALMLTCPLVAERFDRAWIALPLLFQAAVFLALSLITDKHAPPSEKKSHLAVLRFHAGLYFLLATPLALDSQWLTADWALQGVALTWLGARLGRNGKVLLFQGQAATLLALARLLGVDYTDAWGLVTHSGLAQLQGALYTFYGGYANLLAERLLVEALVLGALLAVTVFSTKASSRTQKNAGGHFMRLAFGAGLLAVLSVECAAFFGEYSPGARAATVSALWALYATVLLLHGFRRKRAGARVAALLLYGLTLLKVTLLDMENVATPWRIISFLALGGLLLGGSFLYYRNDSAEKKSQTM